MTDVEFKRKGSAFGGPAVGLEQMKVIKSGFLEKRGNRRNKAYKTRWCVLDINGLAYYKKKDDTTPKGVIKLKDAKCGALTKEGPESFVVQVMHPSPRDYMCRAGDKESAEAWMAAILSVIREHLSNKSVIQSAKALPMAIIEDDGALPDSVSAAFAALSTSPATGAGAAGAGAGAAEAPAAAAASDSSAAAAPVAEVPVAVEASAVVDVGAAAATAEAPAPAAVAAEGDAGPQFHE